MRYHLTAGLFVTLLALGCSTKPPREKRFEVTGKVTFDGVPLAEGTISFDQENGAVPGNATIRNGVYQLPGQPGKNKVIIRAFKVDPNIPVSNDPVRPVDNRVNIIPAVYNDRSTLTADVAKEKTVFNFDLSSKEK